MKRRTSALLLSAGLAVSLLMVGCKAPEGPAQSEHLFAELFVRYLQDVSSIKAHATFFEGDTIETAVSKAFAAGVRFQGQEMEARNLPGGAIRYTFEKNGQYADAFTFSFPNGMGTQQDYSLSLIPIDTFFLTGPASRSAGMQLQVKGGKLQREESMVLLFNDEQNRASTIILSGPSPGESYRIPAAKTAQLKPGPNTLYLVKKKRIVARGDTLSVLADLEFYTPSIEVQVED